MFIVKSFVFLLSLLCLSSAFQPITYVYKTIGDMQILLDVYIPTVPKYLKYPVVFATHGGGYMAGAKHDMAFSTQELEEILRRGWVAVSIDYRLAPAVFLEDIVQDCQDAYNWVRTELVKRISIDPDRIAVFGGSAGGGLAVLNGYRLSPRPKVVVSYYPYCTNWTDPYAYNPNVIITDSFVAAADKLRQNITEYSFTSQDDPRNVLFFDALFSGKTGWLFVSADPKEPSSQILSKLRKLSAIENIDKNYPPTYLSHGLNDSLVPYRQSVQMAEKLKTVGIKHKLDLVPNAEHGFNLVNVTSEMWKEHILPIFDFIQEYMIGFLETEELIV